MWHLTGTWYHVISEIKTRKILNRGNCFVFLPDPLIPFLTYSSCRADFSFAPSQWETALLCDDVSHWLGANLESALIVYVTVQNGDIMIMWKTFPCHAIMINPNPWFLKDGMPLSLQLQRQTDTRASISLPLLRWLRRVLGTGCAHTEWVYWG